MDSTSSSSSSSLCLSLSGLTNSASSTTTPQKKLKEACDLCSTFKIRCDKGKPACGRCLNLNQLCSYSPARRAGRPHRLRQQQQQQKQKQHHAEQQQQQQQQFDNLLNVSLCFNSEKPLAFAAGDFDWGNYDWGMELDASGDEANTVATAITSYPQTHITAALDPARFSSAAIFTSNDLGGSQQNSSSKSSKELVSQVSRDQQPPAGGNSWASISSGTEAMVTQSPNHSDCAQMATSIVEQLDPSCCYQDRQKRPGLSHTPLATTPPPNGEPALATSTTSCCQRLLTILVCPCSEQPVVALLVASACIALLDNILHQQRRDQQHSPPSLGLSSSGSSSSCSLNEYFKYPNPTPPRQCEFEGLAKIAKVVLRFTQRYAQQYEGFVLAGQAILGPGTGATRELLEPIVILLRSKLQFVTEEATGMEVVL